MASKLVSQGRTRAVFKALGPVTASPTRALERYGTAFMSDEYETDGLDFLLTLPSLEDGEAVAL